MKLMAAGDQVLVAEFGDRIDEAVRYMRWLQK